MKPQEFIDKWLGWAKNKEEINDEILADLDVMNKALSIPIVSKRLEMRKQAINVFELTKGFTTEPTDNAMKTALEMAHNVMVLTADLDGM